jgi:hypothetical protein
LSYLHVLTFHHGLLGTDCASAGFCDATKGIAIAASQE